MLKYVGLLSLALALTSCTGHLGVSYDLQLDTAIESPTE